MRLFIQLLLALLLLLPGVALADQVIYKDEVIATVPEGSYLKSQDKVDRFLAQVVQPEIGMGDDALEEYDQKNATRATAHYLKALVLLEQERFRRESR